ncbi:MAG TPA: hypothetical protein VFR67_21845 [Pilimelia sp.]|nr:hypothetical protein [Pilimelia sp.]
MPAPRTPYDAVLHAARDVAKLDCALDAEMLGAALLGSVYAMADGDRAATVREFVGQFLAATARRRAAAATAIRAVFAALVPDAAGADEVQPGAQPPRWAAQLGRVRLTGSHAYGDVFGDQTSYIATFAYEDATHGGPEHAVVALVDHNIGIVKDVFVGREAPLLVARVRKMCAADELTWFAEVDPATLAGEVTGHLDVTDGLGHLPSDGSIATDRMVVGARLALLPRDPSLVAAAPLDTAAREALAHDFLASTEASAAGLSELTGADELTLHFCLSLLLDHADTFPDAQPLRWSPAMVGLFLLDWVHRRAVLDGSDAALLPRTLRAWVEFAGRRRNLPVAAVAQTVAAVDDLAPEFARLHRTGERRSAVTQAVVQLMAEGVDPNDPVALNAWLQANGNTST